MKILHMLAMLLVIIGALNWGLIGAFGEQANLVALLFKSVPAVQRIIYILVGVAALFLIVTYNKYCSAIGKFYKE